MRIGGLQESRGTVPPVVEAGGTEFAGAVVDVLTVGEVAHFLRVTTKTVYALIKRGQLPSFRVGRVVRCRRSDLLRYVEQGCEAALHTARSGERSGLG